MEDDVHWGVSGGTLSNKARVCELGRGSLSTNMLESPLQSEFNVEAQAGGQLAIDGSKKCTKCGMCRDSRRSRSSIPNTCYMMEYKSKTTLSLVSKNLKKFLKENFF